MLRRLAREQRGQSIVVVTLLMVGLTAMLGLALDGGNVYLQRRRMQNAADAAAMAGANRLAEHNGLGSVEDRAIRDIVYLYAQRNGVTDPSTNVQAFYIDATNQSRGQVGQGSVPSEATGIRVIDSTSFPTLFLAVVNETLGSAGARATVQTGSLTGAGGLMPMTIQKEAIKFGPPSQLEGDKTGPGGFQWVSYDCASSEQNLEAYLAIPPTKQSGAIKIGDWICGNPGEKMGAKDEVQTWIDLPDTTGTWFIPVYQEIQGTGSNLQYHVVAFAEFLPTAIWLSNDNKIKGVWGTFVRWVESGEVNPTPTCTYGLCGTQMIE